MALIILILYIILQILDGISTYILLSNKAGKEGNPVIDKLIETIGLAPALTIVKIFGAIIGIVSYILGYEIILYALTAFYIGVVINNSYYVFKNNKYL